MKTAEQLYKKLCDYKKSCSTDKRIIKRANNYANEIIKKLNDECKKDIIKGVTNILLQI